LRSSRIKGLFIQCGAGLSHRRIFAAVAAALAASSMTRQGFEPGGWTCAVGSPFRSARISEMLVDSSTNERLAFLGGLPGRGWLAGSEWCWGDLCHVSQACQQCCCVVRRFAAAACVALQLLHVVLCSLRACCFAAASCVASLSPRVRCFAVAVVVCVLGDRWTAVVH
jgi:hypothetical protein